MGEWINKQWYIHTMHTTQQWKGMILFIKILENPNYFIVTEKQLFIYLFIFSCEHGMWEFVARDQTHTTAITRATVVTAPDP